MAGGVQVGRVEMSENPIRKWISKSFSPLPSTYQRCLQQYWDILVQVWGYGVKVWFWTPFRQEKVPFTNTRHLPLNQIWLSRVSLSGSVLLNSLFGIVCRISLSLEGLSRAWCF